MSTNMTAFSPDVYGRHEAVGVAENAIFSAFYNLLSQRRAEGLTKSVLAEKMNVDRATVTKITSGPTNMKISTMASLANALNVDMVVMFVDRSYRGRYFTSIGMHVAPNCNVAFNTDAISFKDTNVSIGMNTANNATSTFATSTFARTARK
jgi:transcriptional regulator with XRE-family HTH domain